MPIYQANGSDLRPRNDRASLQLFGSIRYPRRQYAEFDRWLETGIKERPALVLIETDPDDQHIDYVVNSPGLADPLLRGRFQRNLSDVRQIQGDFPDRTVYLCDPKRRVLERLR